METEEIIVTVVENEDPDDLDILLTNSFVTEDYDATEERIVKYTSTHACMVCEDVFRNTADLREHMRNSYECRTKKIYRCLKCTELFPTVGTFQLHLLTHTPEKEQPNKKDQDEFSNYVCELCGKDFINKTLTKKHIEQHFDQRGSVLCPTCGKCISSKEMYMRHRSLHGFKSSKDEKKFQCKICNEDLKASRRLRMHLRLHTGEDSFECSVCKKVFLKKSTLKVHLKKTHFKSTKDSTEKKTVKSKRKTRKRKATK